MLINIYATSMKEDYFSLEEAAVSSSPKTAKDDGNGDKRLEYCFDGGRCRNTEWIDDEDSLWDHDNSSRCIDANDVEAEDTTSDDYETEDDDVGNWYSNFESPPATPPHDVVDDVAWRTPVITAAQRLSVLNMSLSKLYSSTECGVSESGLLKCVLVRNTIMSNKLNIIDSSDSNLVLKSNNDLDDYDDDDDDEFEEMRRSTNIGLSHGQAEEVGEERADFNYYLPPRKRTWEGYNIESTPSSYNAVSSDDSSLVDDEDSDPLSWSEMCELEQRQLEQRRNEDALDARAAVLSPPSPAAGIASMSTSYFKRVKFSSDNVHVNSSGVPDSENISWSGHVLINKASPNERLPFGQLNIKPT